MIYQRSLHAWVIIRRLPNMQRVVVNRFRGRREAENYLRVLRRLTPDSDFVIMFDPSTQELQPMARKELNKLVRDNIPAILDSQGIRFESVTMADADYRQALRQKLIEEAQEAAEASEHHIITELADLYEVIDTLMQVYGISRNEVLNSQTIKRIERGGFEQRLRLLWTES
ncbi:MAG: hypothetical protein AB4042_00010 [Leptolyngbyaceae cyanobacterium]